MASFFDSIARRFALTIDPEKAHDAGIKALRRGMVGSDPMQKNATLNIAVAGLDFPNPIGVAAGFDKNGEVPDALLRRGFGFMEVGTVTPLPQDGNPTPRVFRLTEHDAVYQRLKTRARYGGLVGVNIGANKTSDDFVSDYVAGVRRFADLASYFTVNISSPNTPGLRDLQAADALRHLLKAVMAARLEEAQKNERTIPIFLKIAPDIDGDEINSIAEEVLSAKVDGVIVSNTTLARDQVEDAEHADEAGGLSGAPLFDLSTRVLAKMYQALNGALPLIGVGGITKGEDAVEKMLAGASLLQVYTGLIFGGFDLLDDARASLEDAVRRRRVQSVADLVGLETEKWAENPPPDRQ